MNLTVKQWKSMNRIPALTVDPCKMFKGPVQLQMAANLMYILVCRLEYEN